MFRHDKPAVFFFPKIGDLALDPTGVADTNTTNLLTSSTFDIKNPVNRIEMRFIIFNFKGSTFAVFIKSHRDWNKALFQVNHLH